MCWQELQEKAHSNMWDHCHQCGCLSQCTDHSATPPYHIQKNLPPHWVPSGHCPPEGRNQLLGLISSSLLFGSWHRTACLALWSLATNPFLLFIICSDWSISAKSNWMYVVFENWWFPVKKRNPSWVLFLLILWDGWFIKIVGNRCLLIKNIYTSIFHCLFFKQVMYK